MRPKLSSVTRCLGPRRLGQAQILNLLEDLKAEYGPRCSSSPDLAVVKNVSDRVASCTWAICEIGPADTLYESRPTRTRSSSSAPP